MTAAWHWFESQGGVKDLVALGVSLVGAHVLTLLPWFRKRQKTQETIADRLDTDTPGGLADLVRHTKGKP